MDENENKEELKIKLKELLREKNDVFNSENPEEDKVCLNAYSSPLMIDSLMKIYWAKILIFL